MNHEAGHLNLRPIFSTITTANPINTMQQYRKKGTFSVFLQVTEQNFEEAKGICAELRKDVSGVYDLEIALPNNRSCVNLFGSYLVKDECGDWGLWNDSFLNDYEPVSAPSVDAAKQPQSEGGLQWVKGRYDELYLQVKSGIETPCMVDYHPRKQDKVYRDICSIRYPRLELKARGIGYGEVQDFIHWNKELTEEEAFIKLCEQRNVEWLPITIPSTANTAVSALQSILQNIDNQHWNCKDFREEIKSIAEQGLKTANTEEGADERLPVILLTEDQMLRIAKIIDNNFIGAEKTFTAVRKQGYWLLSTNKCDFASEIKIFGTHESLQRIERLGEDTEGWEPIREFTMKRVLELYELFLTETKQQ